MRRRLLILCWHNVEGTVAFPAPHGKGTTGITRQLELLRRSSHVVDLGEAVDQLAHGGRLPDRAVAITFDDGYRDNLEIVAPILRGLGLPATFFLAPELLDGDLPWWEEVAWVLAQTSEPVVWWQGSELSLATDRQAASNRVVDDLKRLDHRERRAAVDALVAALRLPPDVPPPSPIMSWGEAAELQRLGFTIGSHSLRHSILANETPAAQQADLETARHRLSERLGGPVDLLAYPNGSAHDFTRVTEAASTAASYRAAVTTIPGLNDERTPLSSLRRFVVNPELGVRAFSEIPRHYLRLARAKLQPAR